MRRASLLVLLLPLLSGCIITDVAKTTVDVVSVPVKVVGKGIDAALPSQKRDDEKRGRELRKADELRARDERLLLDRCAHGRALPTDRCPAVAPR
jgi:hypothetical protein